MNIHPRTAALLAVGMVSAGSIAQAEEARMSPVETALTSTTISGYVSTSALFSLIGNEGGAQLPGRTFDTADRVNQFNLDVVKLVIERPLSEGDWAAGYKVDMIFGPDANLYGTSSFPNGDSTSDFAIKQAYVALQTPIGNGLIAKVGVFDTIIGYEVFESGNNPNYSRSYGYFIEPFAHTGVLLSYAFTDWLTVNAGIANAFNPRINAPGVEGDTTHDFGIQTYMGSFAITAPDSAGFLAGASLYGGVVHGLTSDGADGDPRTHLYGGVTIPTPVENLGVGVSYEYQFRETVAGDSAYATAIAGYLTYQLTQQMKVSTRAEYATGTRNTWTDPTIPSAANKDEFFALTTSLDYNLWANVLTRLEFRWDTDLSDGGRDFGSVDDPGKNAYILGMNLIYSF